MNSSRLPLLLATALFFGACSSTAPSSEAVSLPVEVEPAETTPVETSELTTTSAAPEAVPSTPTSVPSGPPPDCTVVSDFSTGDAELGWKVVNDDVMGGQSEGDLRLEDNRMTFEGVINTDGGGFSSLRLPVDVGTLASASSIVIRAATDGRAYMVTLDDRLEGRSQRVTHRAAIDLPTIASDASTVTIPIETFSPAVFGQAVEDEPVQPGLIDEIGLMISDGLDGPFRLDVEWVAACP